MMGLSTSTYYKHPDEALAKRGAQSDAALQTAIETVLRD